MIIREARPSDVTSFTKSWSPSMVYGAVCVEDGKLLGGGWVLYGFKGRAWACFHSCERMRQEPIRVTRAVIEGLRKAQEVSSEIYAVQASDKLLSWLGFVETDEVIEGKKVMKWQQP